MEDTPVFMASVNWRGSLHIDPMRVFPTAQEAYDYAKSCSGGTPKAYALYKNQPPVNLMTKAGLKQFNIIP